MTALGAFGWGLFGGMIGEFLSIRRYQFVVFREWPESMRTWTFWLLAIGFMVAGGVATVAYHSSGFKLNAIVAMNVGMTWPFIGENGLDKLLPKGNLGNVD